MSAFDRTSHNMSSSMSLQVACFLFVLAVSVKCANEVENAYGKFFIHTKSFPEGVEVDIFSDVARDDIIHRAATKIITHGYLGNKETYQTIVDNYVATTEDTVFSFEWDVAAHFNESDSSILAVSLGSIVVSNFISHLERKYNMKSDQMHLIGYGMGAHLMGAAGRALQGRLERITGLDPHKKYFDGREIINLPRLTPEDAKFVDILHTDVSGLGYEEPLGTADFYASGGNSQPKCVDVDSVYCNSLMSIDYFAESIKIHDSFIGRECGSFTEFMRGRCNKNPTAVAGEYGNTTAYGTFYFETNINAPYGRKENGSLPCTFL